MFRKPLLERTLCDKHARCSRPRRLTTRFSTPTPGAALCEYYGKSKYRRELGFSPGTQRSKWGREKDLKFPRVSQVRSEEGGEVKIGRSGPTSPVRR